MNNSIGDTIKAFDKLIESLSTLKGFSNIRQLRKGLESIVNNPSPNITAILIEKTDNTVYNYFISIVTSNTEAAQKLKAVLDNSYKNKIIQANDYSNRYAVYELIAATFRMYMNIAQNSTDSRTNSFIVRKVSTLGCVAKYIFENNRYIEIDSRINPEYIANLIIKYYSNNPGIETTEIINTVLDVIDDQYGSVIDKNIDYFKTINDIFKAKVDLYLSKANAIPQNELSSLITTFKNEWDEYLKDTTPEQQAQQQQQQGATKVEENIVSALNNVLKEVSKTNVVNFEMLVNIFKTADNIDILQIAVDKNELNKELINIFNNNGRIFVNAWDSTVANLSKETFGRYSILYRSLHALLKKYKGELYYHKFYAVVMKSLMSDQQQSPYELSVNDVIKAIEQLSSDTTWGTITSSTLKVVSEDKFNPAVRDLKMKTAFMLYYTLYGLSGLNSNKEKLPSIYYKLTKPKKQKYMKDSHGSRVITIQDEGIIKGTSTMLSGSVASNLSVSQELNDVDFSVIRSNDRLMKVYNKYVVQGFASELLYAAFKTIIAAITSVKSHYTNTNSPIDPDSLTIILKQIRIKLSERDLQIIDELNNIKNNPSYSAKDFRSFIEKSKLDFPSDTIDDADKNIFVEFLFTKLFDSLLPRVYARYVKYAKRYGVTPRDEIELKSDLRQVNLDKNIANQIKQAIVSADAAYNIMKTKDKHYVRVLNARLPKLANINTYESAVEYMQKFISEFVRAYALEAAVSKFSKFKANKELQRTFKKRYPQLANRLSFNEFLEAIDASLPEYTTSPALMSVVEFIEALISDLYSIVTEIYPVLLGHVDTRIEHEIEYLTKKFNNDTTAVQEIVNNFSQTGKNSALSIVLQRLSLIGLLKSIANTRVRRSEMFPFLLFLLFKEQQVTKSSPEYASQFAFIPTVIELLMNAPTPQNGENNEEIAQFASSFKIPDIFRYAALHFLGHKQFNSKGKPYFRSFNNLLVYAAGNEPIDNEEVDGTDEEAETIDSSTDIESNMQELIDKGKEILKELSNEEGEEETQQAPQEENEEPNTNIEGSEGQEDTAFKKFTQNTTTIGRFENLENEEENNEE